MQHIGATGSTLNTLTVSFHRLAPSPCDRSITLVGAPRVCEKDRELSFMSTFNITTDAIAGSVGATAAVSTLPLIAFFIMLLGLKARAHTSGAVALLVALLLSLIHI